MKKISLKLQLALFLFAFLVFLSLRESDFFLFIKTMAAVITCAAIDSLLSFFKVKKFKITESSLITGLIIGFVLSSYVQWWLFILAGVLAIISKQIIRCKDKHIFNPAALGIFLVALVFKQATHWHGAVFDPLTGKALKGPAPRGSRLTPIDLNEQDGKIYIES